MIVACALLCLFERVARLAESSAPVVGWRWCDTVEVKSAGLHFDGHVVMVVDAQTTAEIVTDLLYKPAHIARFCIWFSDVNIGCAVFENRSNERSLIADKSG